jgi:HK97 family phage major capsid protein
MPEINEEMKGLKDEISGLITNMQTEIKARETSSDETIAKMADEAAKLTENLQNIAAKVEAEEKSRQELEDIIARKGALGSVQELFGSLEYNEEFQNKFRRKGRITDENLNVELKSIVDYYMPKATSSDKDLAVKMLSVGSNPDMGYYVPLDQIRGISTRQFETSPMRQLATVITTANESVPWIIDDEEAEAEYRCEYEEHTEDTGTPGIAEIVIPTHEIFAYPKATQKVLDDASIDIESWLNTKVVNVFSRKDNRNFFVGDGVKNARGFLTYPAWADAEVYERGGLGHYTTETSLVLDSNDFININSGLLERYQDNAVFTMHRLTWAEVLKLKDGEDRPLINPQLLFQGVKPQLLGKPVVFSGDMAKPSAGVFTAGQKVVAYGDFREGYLIVDRMGIRVLRDNLTSKGFVKWWITKRTGGDVVNYQAIKVLDIKS